MCTGYSVIKQSRTNECPTDPGEGGPEAEKAGYPNEPWPIVKRDLHEQALNPTIAEAVRKLRDTVGPLVRRD